MSHEDEFIGARVKLRAGVAGVSNRPEHIFARHARAMRSGAPIRPFTLGVFADGDE